MFDTVPVLDALADAPPGAESVRVRVVQGRGNAVDGARVALELHPLGGGVVGVRVGAAQAALDRLEPLLLPGRAVRLDWLGPGGRNVPADGRATYFRVPLAEDEPTVSTTTTTRQTVIDHALPPAGGLTAPQLDAGRAATSASVDGALLVALDRAQAQVLEQSRDAQAFARDTTSAVLRSLDAQSTALRVLAGTVGERDRTLIGRVMDAEQRAAQAEAGAALAEAAGGGDDGGLGELVKLVSAVRGGGAPDPKAILPGLLRKLAAGEGQAALAASVRAMTEVERANLLAAIQGAFAP